MTPNTASATTPEVRETALLIPEARPAWPGSTAFMTVVLSGAEDARLEEPQRHHRLSNASLSQSKGREQCRSAQQRGDHIQAGEAGRRRRDQAVHQPAQAQCGQRGAQKVELGLRLCIAAFG